MSDRVAILVIHGMGTQKPYETLDQFARGVENMLPQLTGVPYTQTLHYREHPSDPAHQQKGWTQAFVRLTPEAPQSSGPELIDLIEYYWAPIINGRVRALQSLRFLILSALSPLDYLRANVLVINQVSGVDDEPRARRIVQEGFSNTSPKRQIASILYREIKRSIFIFFPLILLLAGIYAALARPLLDSLLGHGQSTALAFFWAALCPEPAWRGVLDVAFMALRWLLIFMSAKFLWDARTPPANATSEQKKLLTWCNRWIILLLVVLLLTPFLANAVIGLMNNASTPIAQDASDQAGPLSHLLQPILTFFHRQIAFAPLCLRLLHLFLYLGLAALAYAVNLFLTTAIGDLAVYLGSDTLSTNFAARSQILEECTATVLELLKPHIDLCAIDPPVFYDRVILAAHSLGSVIAYDTLNDLMAKQKAAKVEDNSLQRITALFTFGCPLNKVFYFFGSRTGPETTILSQILYSLHNFRLRVPPPAGAAPTPGSFAPNFCWYNAWCPKDVISGRMLFYHADKNQIVAQGWEPASAHTGYWKNPALYTFFSELLKTPVP